MARRKAKEEARNLYKMGKLMREISLLLDAQVSTISRWKKEDLERSGIDWDKLRLEWERSESGTLDRLKKYYDKLLEKLDNAARTGEVDSGLADALHKIFIQMEKFEKGVSGEKILLVMDRFTDYVAREETDNRIRERIGDHVGNFIRAELRR